MSNPILQVSDVTKENSEKINAVFTVDLVKETQALPLDLNGNVLKVLCEDTQDIFLLSRLELLTGCRVELVKGELADIEQRLARFHEQYDQLGSMTEDFKLEIVVDGDDGEIIRTLNASEEVEGPIVKLINSIISSALTKRASDIHIQCDEFSIKVKYRIDGVLYPATEDLDISFHSSLVSRLKVMAELDIAERQIPQDGRFKLRMGKRNIDFRISVIPSFFGESVVVRVLDNSRAGGNIDGLKLDEMGFNQEQLKAFKKAINEPHGMVLITGPTGSGKTTTLYSAIQQINTGEQKIITIEDPIEYHLNGIMQIPVNTKKGLTFAKGLRSILRHDPDKILVGEIRDAETAEIAIQSALTGHLVFSSVHANSAYDVMARMQNIGANIGNCLTALNCIVSQRLIRLNCKKCWKAIPSAQTTTEHAALVEEFEPHSFMYESILPPTFAYGKGCSSCSGTGYAGRSMICEVLVIDEAVNDAVLDQHSVSESLKKAGLVSGIDLRVSALSMVLKGDVSIEEMNRVTFS